MISFSLEPELVNQRLQSTPELSDRLFDLLNAYATTGSPAKSKQYDPEESYVPLVDTIRDGMELFIVAHEFGHVYAGHLSDFLRRRGMLPDNLEDENPSHILEHEADLLGLLLTLQAMSARGYDAALSYVGIELFFSSLEIAARARHILEHGTEDGYVDAPSDTHPSNAQRQEVLRGALPLLIKSEEKAKGALDMSARYLQIADLLWQAVKSANTSFGRSTG